MKPLSSRLKTALLSAIISGVVLLGFGGILWFVVYDLRIRAVDREIRTVAFRRPGLFAGRASQERLTSSLEFAYGPRHTNHIILLLRDANNRTLYQSPHWPGELHPDQLNLELVPDPQATAAPPSNSIASTDEDASPALPLGAGRAGRGRGFGPGRGGPPPTVVFTKIPKFFTIQTADSAWRIGVLGTEDLTLVIGLNYDEVQGELNRVRNAFLLALPIALFLVGSGGWIVAGRALRPLKIIAETAERVTVRGLDQRIPESKEGPETSRLIQVLNRMMDRLEASFHQATRFSADASHELNTPLAVMQGELENALQAAPYGSPEQQLCSNLLEETQRLKTITRNLLMLAQADAGQLNLALEPLDLSAALDGMMEDARVLANDLNLSFTVDIQPRVRVQADRALLHTAIFNLISNAIRYNQPNGQVRLTLITSDTHTLFTVCNTGPGIPPDEQSKIFNRFHCVGRSAGSATRAPGIGLGLSLAREFVRAHGGDLILKESRPGWTCFELRLKRIPT